MYYKALLDEIFALSFLMARAFAFYIEIPSSCTYYIDCAETKVFNDIILRK